MKKIDLDENEGIEINAGSMRLYVSYVEIVDDRFSHGFHVVSDKSFVVIPRAENSIHIVPDLLHPATIARGKKQ